MMLAWSAGIRKGSGIAHQRGAMSSGVKKVIVIGVVVLVLFFLISQPTHSAEMVHRVLGWLKDGADAIVTFFKQVFS
ncbi:hypothetical protein D5S19_24075 [Amycolatopsis panacis]|uniref:Uncharacterized protein n=1 Tax=Amycolatopsis panacis TaxID=2340917 RepID=A0A419HW01_9PSEU|nr:hypothetical protein D5S19_24075 [Amycolatopsis panacis]